MSAPSPTLPNDCPDCKDLGYAWDNCGACVVDHATAVDLARCLRNGDDDLVAALEAFMARCRERVSPPR